jgi:hypothetical protein
MTDTEVRVRPQVGWSAMPGVPTVDCQHRQDCWGIHTDFERVHPSIYEYHGDLKVSIEHTTRT